MWDPTSEAALATFEMLGLAFILCAFIGLERQFRQKSAGLRTHTLVGLGSAVFTLISAYGFASVLDVDVVVDPSRIAAQIVSGIGFLGAGVIFVRKDAVRGLTTAATIWVSAAVGMACGAGLPILAITATVLNMTAQFVLTKLGRLFTPGDSRRIAELRYQPGNGVLGDIFGVAAMHGFSASVIASDATGPTQDAGVLLVLALDGRSDSGRLVAGIADVPGVLAVRLVDDDDDL